MTPYEKVLQDCCKEAMIQYLESNPQDFDEAFELAIGNDQSLGWRSAWLLGNALAKNDNRIQKYLKRTIAAIPGKNGGHQRELLKIVDLIDLDEEDQGNLFEVCNNLWLNFSARPSVRHRALLTMCKIAKNYPELKNEIKIITTAEYLVPLSPGIKNAAIKLISDL